MDFIDIFLHLDRHLNEWVLFFGPGIDVLLFLIVFCETGLVVTPFLPGDSLLFAVGALAATENSSLNIFELLVFLTAAAILGDAVNYAIGWRVGPKIFQNPTGRWLNKKHLLEAERFYERHGGKTILFARFLPIVRTFAPFVAGIGRMPYPRFAAYNVTGGVLWVGSILMAGYFCGNIPIVRQNFEWVVVGIIVVSLLPTFLHLMKKPTKV